MSGYYGKRKVFNRKVQGKMGTEILILTDENTGVQYMYYRNGAGGGMTVLVDSEENPLLNKE